MATTEEELALWIRRISELERELDAATKLAEVKAIAAELRQTKAALKKPRLRPGMRSSIPDVRRLDRARAATRATQASP